MAHVDQYKWSLPGAGIHPFVAALVVASLGPCILFCHRPSLDPPLLSVNAGLRYAPFRVIPPVRYVCVCVRVYVAEFAHPVGPARNKRPSRTASAELCRCGETLLLVSIFIQLRLKARRAVVASGTTERRTVRQS